MIEKSVVSYQDNQLLSNSFIVVCDMISVQPRKKLYLIIHIMEGVIVYSYFMPV